MKQFQTKEEMSAWLSNTAYDRYSPFDVIHVNWELLFVRYVRVD